MSLPQPHQAHSASADSPPEDNQSPSIVRYESIQGALGGRRASHHVPVTYRTVSDIPSQSHHMASDSRYIYTSTSSSAPQTHHFQYDHQSYPPSPSYDSAQSSHNVLPRMRTPLAHPESSRGPVNQTSQGYSMQYLTYSQTQQQAHYAIPSGMTTASWLSGYSQYPPTPSDASLSPEIVRSEPMPPPPQHSQGAYRTPVAGYSAYLEEASRHSSSSSSRAPSVSESKGKQREVAPSIPPSRPSSDGLDFHKLSVTYQHILDNTPPGGSMTDPLPSGLPTSETLDRIYDFAVEGVRQFDPSDREDQPRSATPQTRSHPPKGDIVGKSSARRQRPEGSTAETQRCMGCGATSTPEWRRGPLGPRTLCNACGLVYAKLIKKRGRDAAGRSIIEGGAGYSAHSTGSFPGELVQDYGLAAGHSAGVHHSHHGQDDEDREHLTGDGSEDGSYDDQGQTQSGQG